MGEGWNSNILKKARESSWIEKRREIITDKEEEKEAERKLEKLRKAKRE